LVVAATPALAGQDADLWSAAWHLDTWGYHGAGTVIWVRDPSAVRLDIGLNPPAALDRDRVWLDPWERRGAGWTVLALADGTGLLEPWGEQWRELEPYLVVMTRALVGAVADSPSSAANSGSPKRRRLAVPPAPDTRGYSALRSELASRGLGQGGAGELVTLESGGSEGRIVMRSSRRPGRLTLDMNWRGIPLGEVAPELFAPLWPLSDFLKFPTAIPEPGADPGVELEAVPHGGQGPGVDP